jgi:hypothetical protein
MFPQINVISRLKAPCIIMKTFSEPGFPAFARTWTSGALCPLPEALIVPSLRFRVAEQGVRIFDFLIALLGFFESILVPVELGRLDSSCLGQLRSVGVVRKSQ